MKRSDLLNKTKTSRPRRRYANFGSTSDIIGGVNPEDVPSFSVTNTLGIKERIARMRSQTNEADIPMSNSNERVKNAKKVIFTCITGGYDPIVDPIKKIDGYDYVLFTDNVNVYSTVWQIRPIPEELLELSKTKQQRCVKICPHKYLPEYDMSVWADGNLKLNFEIDKFINSFVDDTHNVFVKTHPARKCAYREKVACAQMRKDDDAIMTKQMEIYKKEGFPENFGLSETNFMVRFHNEKDCITLMDAWAEEVKKHSKRDQLSFNYCVWKTKTNIKYFKSIKNLVPASHPHKNASIINYKYPKKVDCINLCVVNYNTKKLLDCLIKSLDKTVPSYKLYIFDNSDTEPVYTTNKKNVAIFDNTKGQYIDFNKFLSKYPNRGTSPGRLNNFGSAKHCISIEKCMELIEDNFILLDSDILIKKDISHLFNDNYIYIAEIQKNKLYGVNRVLPYICFINNKKCKEEGIHFFDEKYMYGLGLDKTSEKYDTGGAFYINASKHEHFEIKYNDYIVHYKGASWVFNKMTTDQWLTRYKKWWN